MIHPKIAIILPDDYNTESLPEKIDVSTLYLDEKHEDLACIVVCKDSQGNSTALFGDDIWDCFPLVTTKNSSRKTLNFMQLQDCPHLQLEAKIVVYGWLFNRSSWTSTPAKFSTISGRLSALIITYQFLKQNELSGLAALSDDMVFAEYLSFLKSLDKSAGTLVHYLSSLQQAVLILSHLDISIRLPEIEPVKLSKKLCKAGTEDREQNLAIPQSIADTLYGKAIELVEQAWPYRNDLGQLEQDFQENYEAGQRVVDEKIRNGEWTWIEIKGDAKNKHAKAREANRFQPYSGQELLQLARKKISYIPAGSNGHWWNSYRTDIATSCLICCGAFSGMRESEIFELTKESFEEATYNHQTFNLVRSKTHKLGQKHTKWVVAPIVKKAIELIAALNSSLQLRLYENAKDEKHKELADCLWLSQSIRSEPPIVTKSINLQLRKFAKKHNAIVTHEVLEECKALNPNSAGRIEKTIIVGQPWYFTTHQFRRTLAVFTVRHRLGNSIALKEQYKHLYLEMSHWYTEGGIPTRLKDVQIDEDLKRSIDSEYDISVASKFMTWMNSDTTLSGSHGKAIMKMRDDVPVIYSSWDVIYKAVKEKRLTLHGTMHSYCKAGYECDMDGVTNPAFCVDCRSGSSIIDDTQAKWWKSQHQTLTNYLQDRPDVSPSEYAHCITQIRAAEIVMKDFKIPYDTYHHPIEVMSI
ncbi:hypothetical protein AB4277_13200 [Vibrio splendidus]